MDAVRSRLSLQAVRSVRIHRRGTGRCCRILILIMIMQTYRRLNQPPVKDDIFMKIRRINENTISCIITPEDLRENGFRIDDFFDR